MRHSESLRLVKSLARITGLDEPKAIYQCVLHALGEIHRAQQLRFYQFMHESAEPDLELLAHSCDGVALHDQNSASSASLSDEVQQALQQIASGDQVASVRIGEDALVYRVFPREAVRRTGFVVWVERATVIDAGSVEVCLEFLQVFANYMCLLEKTRRDKLTGVLNRETLADEISRILVLNQGQSAFEEVPQPLVDSDARQHKGALKTWVGVLDIDHFKRVNDTFGHLYGDEVLILVARLMEASVRNYDLIFRYGGEEFVILLKASDLEDARLGFERMRTAVGHHDYAKAEQITVSIGIVEVAAQSGPTEVLGQADEALYFAKQHGRDQVRFYEELISQGLIKRHSEEIETGGVNYF